MTKRTLMVRDETGELCSIQVSVVERDQDLWAFEEPPEPVITVTYDGSSWVVYGDENSDHEHYGEKWWPAVLYGGNRYEAQAKDYAKRWAKAVRGVYEVI